MRTTYRPRPPYPPDWTEIAEAAREAVDWHCEECGLAGLTPDLYDRWQEPNLKARIIEVHHLDCNPANCSHQNLRCLCKRCHTAAHAALRRKRKEEQQPTIPALA